MNVIKGTNRALIKVSTYWLDENNGEYFRVLDERSYAPDFVLVATWIEDEDGKMQNAHKELVPVEKFKQLTLLV